jgi:hypothetical protein
MVPHILANCIMDRNMEEEFSNRCFKNTKANGNKIESKDKESIKYFRQGLRFKEVSEITSSMERQLKIHIIILMMGNMLMGEGKDWVNKLMIGKD